MADISTNPHSSPGSRPMRYPMATYQQAIKALAIARRIHPDTHWFISNESGGWDVVES